MIRIPEFLRALSEGRVQYVLIGGAAIGAHGSSYLTEDADIIFLQSRENCRLLASTLAAYHPKLRGAEELPFVLDERTLMNGQIFTLSTDLGPIDLLGEAPGIGRFAEALKSASPIDLFGEQVQVLSVEGLIRAKRAAGRPKDLLILPELEAMLELKKATEP